MAVDFATAFTEGFSVEVVDIVDHISQFISIVSRNYHCLLGGYFDTPHPCLQVTYTGSTCGDMGLTHHRDDLRDEAP